MKKFSGKRYFYWLGFQNGTRKVFRESVTTNLPQWAKDSYGNGWIKGFYSVSE